MTVSGDHLRPLFQRKEKERINIYQDAEPDSYTPVDGSGDAAGKL